MRVSLNWLGKMVDISDQSPEDISNLLTSRGLETEEIIMPEISNVVIGKITEIKKHEDSDKLWICALDVGDKNDGKPVQIVTGAQNLKQDDIVPVALHGSNLPGGIKIKKGKLRGEVSEGMLCSGQELELTDADYTGADVDGIMVLHGEYELGADVTKVLELDDIIIVCEPTPNRPDWNSMISVAKEVGAGLSRKCNLPDAQYEPDSSGNISEFASVSVEDKKLCPRYVARMIDDVKIEQSPMWLKRALRSCGMRPVNNIVDITNYVMLETGQPLHAFDLDCVDGGNIIVRKSAKHEKIVTLDEKERIMPDNTIMIADEKKAVGIAGIMGGENSEIVDRTQKVLLESALFDRTSIRLSSKAMGLTSDAAARFIKGLDIETTEYASKRACQLICKLGAGKILHGNIDIVEPEALVRKKIKVDSDKVSKILGIEVSQDKVIKILEELEMPCEIVEDDVFAEIPYSRNDMDGNADVAEEVMRTIGVDKIPLTLMKGELHRGGLTKKQKFIDNIMMTLYGSGAFEIMTYAFTGQSVYDKLKLSSDSKLRKSPELENPFGEDTSLMRSTLLTGMLPVIATNAKRKHKSFRLFEISNVHFDTKTDEGLPTEIKNLCFSVYGEGEDFYTLKGTIYQLCYALSIQVRSMEVISGGKDMFHPGRKAYILIDGEIVGEMGEIHPDVADAFEIPGKACVCELNTDKLFSHVNEDIIFEPIAKFPSMRRDIALVVDAGIESASLEKVMYNAAKDLLDNVELFDVYIGENMPSGKKSVAYSLEFLSQDRTLTDEEVSDRIAKILTSLRDEYDARLRE